VLERAGERLVLSKVAKKTDEAYGKLRDAIDALQTHAAQTLHELFPFLNAEALRRLQQAMPEGRSCPETALAAIHPNLPKAVEAHAVDEALRPYFETLRGMAKGPLEVGFKFTTVSDGEEEAPAEEEKPWFFWYFFPLANGLAAWEATTGTGRATYFFRAAAPVEMSIARLTRGLALVNFRREPVYLPDASLEEQARYHRYAIGARKLPELRELRKAYVGRAIHSTVENYQAQVAALVKTAHAAEVLGGKGK